MPNTPIARKEAVRSLTGTSQGVQKSQSPSPSQSQTSRIACQSCDVAMNVPVVNDARNSVPDASTLRSTSEGRQSRTLAKLGCTINVRYILQATGSQILQQKQPSPGGVRHATTSVLDPANQRESSAGSLLQDDQVHLMRQASIPTDSYASQLRKAENREEIKQSDPRAACEESSLPPLAAGLALLEIYFARIYNASLLFWKPKLFSEYVEGQVPSYLLKAIFGTAAFLAPNHEEQHFGPTRFSELDALRVFHKRSLSWAKAASSEAMALAIPDPSLSVVQALEVLVPYWYGTGLSRCGDLSLALAYRCCCIMQYGGNRDGSAEDLSLEAELKRRCFWACWASMCIVASPEPYVRHSWSEIARVPLPASISNTTTGLHIKLTDYMDADWIASKIYGDHDREEPPVAAAMMKMVGVWAKVQLSVRDGANYDTSRKVQETRGLSELATTTYATVSLAHRKQLMDLLVSEHAFGLTHQLLFFDGLYHLSQITLYSTLVPLFSGSQMDPSVDITIVQSSAKAAVRHAWLFGGILKDYLGGRVDVTYLSSLLGYCAFICGTVLLSFEISREGRNPIAFIPELGEASSTLPTVEMFVDTLDASSRFWNVLRRPFEKLSAALKGASAQLISRHPEAAQSLGSSSAPNERNHARAHLRTTDPFLPSQEQGNSSLGGEDKVLNHVQSRIHPLPRMEPLDFSTGIPLDSQPMTTCVLTNNLSLETLESYDDWNDDWWNMPFAAAGNDQLTGFEPMLLFRQAWEGLA
ncbi:uncharacterized protein A1O9_09358 [Exophiala aquamarina CBS 119918]|uniref:Xylanolytic transcriptional activator regulatory domain-containing protein n=1 Tax=Exophiala aquamarina CBS 119918 TaxID=1182545 RepID=A0A072PHB5_9EURO|nr:uncharacterized protein A1O9_09358 [Exophiala aquamarina CBS 119918]KEF54915.1 hypothetical protein A1O9_09358 [Exophiala aquamarina CBS 119918]